MLISKYWCRDFQMTFKMSGKNNHKNVGQKFKKNDWYSLKQNRVKKIHLTKHYEVFKD